MNIMFIAIMIYGIAMLPSLIMAIRYEEVGVYKCMYTLSALCIFFGFIGYRFLPNNLVNVKLRVCYMTTILTWLLLIFLSALPYYTSGMHYSFIDCLFESTASWTTTGASAIVNSTLPIGLKLWRSTCNWMGGIGIILLTLTFLPSWQFVGHRLATTEVRGPSFLMSTITFRKAYRRILFIYLGITLLQYVLLRIAGMPQLSSLLTALSNTSTSGLQHLNNGVITYLSTPVKVIITVFAFIGSVNVSVLVSLLIGRFSVLKRNSEIKMYLLEIALVSLVIAASLAIIDKSGSFLSSLGDSVMQVISFASTAGYIIVPCSNWNSLAISLIIFISLLGACAISTGGGLKMARVVYAFKTLSNTIYSHLHPRSIRTITYNGQPTKTENITRSCMYIALFMVTLVLGGLLLTADGTDLYTAISYSQAMISNVGSPITELADPGIVAGVSSFNKSVMSLLMLCGRLEIYPVLMIFSLNFWSGDINKK